jgi:hypothetical protein
LERITSKEPIPLVASMSNIPIELLEIMHTDSLLSLYELCSFVLDDFDGKARIKRTIDVGDESWAKLELLIQASSTNIIPYIAVQACGIYFGESVYKWRFEIVYGQTYQILSSLSVFLERFKDLRNSEPYNDDQLEAGIEGLESFGVAGVRYSLAKGNPKDYKAIEESKAEDIYMTLLYEKGVSIYKERLEKIYKRKNNVST